HAERSPFPDDLPGVRIGDEADAPRVPGGVARLRGAARVLDEAEAEDREDDQTGEEKDERLSHPTGRLLPLGRSLRRSRLGQRHVVWSLLGLSPNPLRKRRRGTEDETG